MVVVIHGFIPSTYRYVMPISWFERGRVRWTGVILLVVSLVWTILAQAQLGNSWRIGMDFEHRTNLVERGVFGISRNPIFVGMVVTLLGIFLMIPNAGTLITLLVGIILIGIQVRLEEEYLTRVHGEEYLQYRRRVRRWL